MSPTLSAAIWANTKLRSWIPSVTPETAAAYSLLNAQAVRDRAHRMLALGLDDKLPNFRVDLDRLDDAVDLVLAAMNKNYPTLDVPFHSRWRHFVTNGFDRHADLAEDFADPIGAGALGLRSCHRQRPARRRRRSAMALPRSGNRWPFCALRGAWRWQASTCLRCGDFSSRHGMSADPADQLRADADALANLDTETVRDGFQVTDDNPLVGLEGRAELLRSLGRLVTQRPEIFARHDTPRPGGFFDHLVAKAEGGPIPAPLILSELLLQFGPIWPSRLTLGGVPLGDCWRHPSLTRRMRPAGSCRCTSFRSGWLIR